MLSTAAACAPQHLQNRGLHATAVCLMLCNCCWLRTSVMKPGLPFSNTLRVTWSAA
jgi:hypothetical protein